MKKMIMTLAAVLCCAMTTTVFIACGDDDEDIATPQTPNEQKETAKVPVYAGVQYKVNNRADMLKYLDVVVKYSDGVKEYSSPVLTEELVEPNYDYKTPVLLTTLPAHFTIWREVKVKEAFQDSVKNLKTFDFTNYIDYGYALYDADRKMIGSIIEGQFGFIHTPGNQNAEMVSNFLSKLDYNFGKVFELNFDKDGNKK